MNQCVVCVGERGESVASTGEGGRWGGAKEGLAGGANWPSVSAETSGGTVGGEREAHTDLSAKVEYVWFDGFFVHCFFSSGTSQPVRSGVKQRRL